MYKSIDDGYEAMFVQDVLAEKKERELKEVTVGENSALVGKTVVEADVHERTGVVLVGIGEEGKLNIDPSRNFVIKAGDVILGIGKPEEFERLEKECAASEK